MIKTIDKKDYMPEPAKDTRKLAIISVGEDKASKVYLNNKAKICNELGIGAVIYNLPKWSTERTIIDLIQGLNERTSIKGIIVQLPLPKHLDPINIVNFIDPNKDVDGLTFTSIGKLEQGLDCHVPATARGIMEFFEHEGIELEGKKVLIIGRSQLVGRPLQKLLLRENAVPTTSHSYDKDLLESIKNYDVVVSGIGKPNYIQEEHVKENQILVDVGISKVEGKIYGDITDKAKEKAKLGTAVPKGVGVLTTVCLAKNVLESKL